jgi:hypothetical protein
MSQSREKNILPLGVKETANSHSKRSRHSGAAKRKTKSAIYLNE